MRGSKVWVLGHSRCRVWDGKAEVRGRVRGRVRVRVRGAVSGMGRLRGSPAAATRRCGRDLVTRHSPLAVADPSEKPSPGVSLAACLTLKKPRASF